MKTLRITGMDVSIVEAPLVTPFRIATGQHNTLRNVFVRLTLAGGVKGFGEAAIASHITGETVEATAANLRDAAVVARGEDMADHRAFLYAFRDKFADNHAGLAALEMAVLDAWTRSMKLPLWALFGARPVPLCSDITIVIGSLAEAGEAARVYARQGFRAFKVKVGRDHGLDLARVLAVRKAAPRAAIILDANQGFTAQGALKFLRELKGRGVRPVLVEQPVPKDDWDGLKQVTRGAGTLVCADESIKSLADVVFAVRTRSVSAVNVKLMKSGILEAEAMARTARAAGLELMIGAMMESGLALSAAAHMAAGMGCFRFVDLDTAYFLKGRWARVPFLDEKGCYDLKDAGAGIGVVPRP